MFRIKICGVTNVPDAITAVDAGADAIGLNFYLKSPRCVDLDEAGKISDAVATRGALPVGVFVNHHPDEVEALSGFGRLGGWQFHGDESPELFATLGDSCVRAIVMASGETPILRVRRFDNRGVAAIADDLAACRAAGRCPDAVLVDALTPGRYGGTGETVSWLGLADHRRWLGDTPLILAGGLTPDNVAEAIRIVRPHGVDVASGVESAPGKKDPVKVRDFIAAARAAFGE
jgi:phosphoribosylanthranilate isomerase